MEAREFGEYLRALRKTKKLTIRQLDVYSGVSNSYISQMERGERGIPSPEILSKLSKPLGVTYEELMQAAGYLQNDTYDQENKKDLTDKQNEFIIREIVKKYGIDLTIPGQREKIENIIKLVIDDHTKK